MNRPIPNQSHCTYCRHTHTSARAHLHTHTTSWQNEQIAASALPFVSLTLKFTWSLVSQGYVRREQGARVWTEIREINLISIRAADANAREFVSVPACTHCMHVRRHTNLSVKERPACTVFSLCSACHIFFFTNSLSANNVCGRG